MAPSFETTADIVDAEFETVGASAGPVADFAAGGIGSHGRAELRPAGVSMLTPGRSPSGWFQPAGPAFWTAGLAAAGAAFWLAGGHALFGDLDRLAPSPAASLRVAQFSSRMEAGAGGPLLTVEGELANDGRAPAPVPPFSIDITTGDGATMRYFVASNGSPMVLARGRYRFTSRLAVPVGRIERVTITLEPGASGGSGGRA